MSPYKNEEDRKRWSKEYYQKNREKKIEYSKQRHLENREENLKKMRDAYKAKKGSTKRSLESISLPGEVWKLSVVDGKVHPWYSVSNMGRVASHFANKSKGHRPYAAGRGVGFSGWDRSYDPEYCRLMKPAASYKNNHDPNKRDVYGNTLKVGDKIIQATRVSFRFPWDFFQDINMYGSEYQYPIQGRESAMNGKCCQRTLSIHKLVANAHMSVDDFPPERIAGVYAHLPEEVKQWIRETVIINHIDHDPTNNCVTNLEYVTPRENCHKAVQQYGGHFCPDQYLKNKKPVTVEENQSTYQNALEKLLES